MNPFPCLEQKLRHQSRTVMGCAASAVLVVLTLVGPTTADGTTWEPVGLSGGGGMFAPAISPADPSLLMLNCDMGAAYLSDDGGRNWHTAELGKDHGKYSFRPWTFAWTPAKSGACELKCRAVNRLGESQALEPLWNPQGYMRNVVETTKVNVA